jgi:MscS family membrane protein
MPDEGRGLSQLTPGEQSSMLTHLSATKVLFVATLIAGTFVLLRWIKGFLDGLESGNPRLRFLLRQVEPPVRIAIWFAAILVSAEILAPSQNAFLAALGSAALAIGLGLQDLIKNLIGGLVVIVDRPFQTGDRVKIGEAYGEVKQIGLRSTRVLADNGMLISVPNSDVLNKLIFNANVGVAECVVSAEIILPPDADADIALHICHEIAVCCPYIHLGRHIEVELNEDSRHSRTILTVQAHVYDHRFAAAMKTDILRRSRRELLACGVLRQVDAAKPREQGAA